MLTCHFENNATASLRHVVVDTVVIKDDQILLVKRTGKLLEGGKWALPGGFVDRDETTAQAAAREVVEETGYTIKNLKLLTIRDNPDRPHEDRQNIAFIYFAEAVDQISVPDQEADDIQWWPLAALPEEAELAFDHKANIMLYTRFVAGEFTFPFMPS